MSELNDFTQRVMSEFRNGYANIERVARGQAPWRVIPEMRDLFPAA